MSISHAFKAGWQDRLLSLPTPPKYERCRTGIAVAYERGRHAAALWEHEVTQHGGTLHMFRERATVKDDPLGAVLVIKSYAEARKTMSKELRSLIRAEAKFCSLKKPTWNY